MADTKTPLTALRSLLLQHVALDGAPKMLGALGVFHCRQYQHIKAVPILQPTLILIVSGKKIIFSDGRQQEYTAGQVVLLPENSQVEIRNEPDSQHDYLALSFSPTLASLEAFKQQYATQVALWAQTPHTTGWASPELLFSFSQWVVLSSQERVPEILHQHRAQEILLLLAEQTLVGAFFAQQHPSWKQKVAAFIALEASRAWLVDDVAKHFNCSPATLRRRLMEEGAQFRQVLEDVRLSNGLSLLQESNWSIAVIAQAVGYESPSRFSERFKKRFGLTPQALRSTRLAAIASLPQIATPA